jgi:thiamine monophosphate kinase
VLIVSENGARAGDTLYLTGTIGTPRLDGDAAEALLLGIRQMFTPHALADTANGILAAAREIARNTGFGFRIIEETLPVAAESAEKARDGILTAAMRTAHGGYLFCSPRRPVATMTITIDGIRITPVGELLRTGRTVERNGKSNNADCDAADIDAP